MIKTNIKSLGSLIFLLVLTIGVILISGYTKKSEEIYAGVKTSEELGVPIYAGAEYSAESSENLRDLYDILDRDKYSHFSVYYTNDSPEKVIAFYESKTKLKNDIDSDFINGKAKSVKTGKEIIWCIPIEGKAITSFGKEALIYSLKMTVKSPFIKRFAERRYKNYKTQIIIEEVKPEIVEKEYKEWKEGNN